ncbi:MAG: lactate racemase domain-containing protein [Oscillochloridaceae bacterium umkhey_bin13]
MHLSLNHDALDFVGPLPSLWRVRQHWDEQPLADLPAATVAALDQLGLVLPPGARVAVTAGSRGISGLVPITRAAIAWLRAHGAEPFVVPAMGSHGGATAEGQLQLLAGLGITETSLDCPIYSSMEVVDLGLARDGTPVFMDRLAAEADAVLVINRVKAHTSFDGPIASGLAKMCAVGLGKREGAAIFHRDGAAGMRNRLVPMARVIVERGRVLAGLAILEGAREQVVDLVALPPAEIGGPGEAALLERSRSLMARLTFDRLDVLVVDQIGKEISGTGMDTNVIGRRPEPGEPPPASPIIKVIVALDLTETSRGNANGMGLADLVTAQLVAKVDFHATYTNALTAGVVGLPKAALPMTLPSTRAAILAAIRSCGQPDPTRVRLVRITNTLQLEELLVSAALLPEVAAQARLELIGPALWEGL